MMSKTYTGNAGGFNAEGGSQMMQSSPVKNRIGGSLASQTLKPVTIKQLNEAVMSHPESPFQVDGHELSQVTLIACLRTLKEQANGSDYLLEDGTGSICGHVWANDRNSGADWLRCFREGDWLRVYGTLKSTNNAGKYLQINQLRKMESSDELTHHFLQTIQLHLSNTGRTASKQSNDFSGPVSTGFTPIQTAVHQLYMQCKNDLGLHINSVIQSLRGRYADPDIRSAVNWLMNEGYLYQTIDNDHAKSTESG